MSIACLQSRWLDAQGCHWGPRLREILLATLSMTHGYFHWKQGKLDQKIFVLFNPLFHSILQLLKGFLKKGRKLLIIDGHIWCWWLSAVSERQLYIHERATHLNFYWYLMTDLKVVTVYSSSLESRHQSPHNMNFFSF